MSFFIDEAHLFSGLANFLYGVHSFNFSKFLYNQLKPQSKDQPNYTFRDDIEDAIDEMLPKKDTISVDGSKIKVELFHSGVSPEELIKIEKVINDTFKVFQKYNATPSNDKDISFRMFLFEDRQQYADIRKSLHNKVSVPDDELGVTINKYDNDPLTDSDVSIYQKLGIDYFTLAHEFAHCIQNVVKSKDAYLPQPVTEGSAEAFACEALGQESYVPCGSLMFSGLHTIKSNNITLRDVYYSKSTVVEDNAYTTGLVMLDFLNKKHHTVLEDIIDYSLTGKGTDTKWEKIFFGLYDIEQKGEFTNWVDDQCTQYHCMDAII